jgi:lipopolysaccharide/colanic/teichoic acid biosynthesis glycosyltransferase
MRPFTLWKVRSMRPAATGPSVTAADDTRITPAGRLLRRFKLDELPQLWNVARGDMSLVGSRPEVPEWVERFRAEFEDVLEVRPGLSDLASIIHFDEEAVLALTADRDAAYGEAILPDKLALNRLYVDNLSLRLDLHVIGLTLASIVARDWAAGRARRLAGSLARGE